MTTEVFTDIYIDFLTTYYSNNLYRNDISFLLTKQYYSAVAEYVDKKLTAADWADRYDLQTGFTNTYVIILFFASKLDISLDQLIVIGGTTSIPFTNTYNQFSTFIQKLCADLAQPLKGTTINLPLTSHLKVFDRGIYLPEESKVYFSIPDTSVLNNPNDFGDLLTPALAFVTGSIYLQPAIMFQLHIPAALKKFPFIPTLGTFLQSNVSKTSFQLVCEGVKKTKEDGKVYKGLSFTVPNIRMVKEFILKYAVLK